MAAAKVVGSEMVNEIATALYQFDQTDLNLAERAGAVTGEMGLAESGGQVVR